MDELIYNVLLGQFAVLDFKFGATSKMSKNKKKVLN